MSKPQKPVYVDQFSKTVSTVDLTSFSDSELKDFVEVLKKSTKSSDLILGFQFLGRLCTSVNDAGLNILETGRIIDFISGIIRNHEDKKVRMHALGTLVVLSLSIGEYKPELAADTSLSMLTNIFSETKFPLNLDLVDTIGLQLQPLPRTASSSRTASRSHTEQLLESAIVLIDGLRLLLLEKDVSDKDREDVVQELLDILDGDFFVPIIEAQGGGGGGKGKSSSSSTPPSSYPPAFLAALSQLVPVLETIKASSRKHLRAVCVGVIDLLKENYGLEGSPVEQAGLKKKKDEKKEQTIVCHYLNNPHGGYTLSGMTLTFLSNSHTVFLDLVMTKGIYKLTVTFVPGLMVGVQKSDAIVKSMDSYFGGNVSALYIGQDSGYVPDFYPKGCGSHTDTSCRANDKSTISAEVNMDAHTLHFFVDERLFTHYLTSVPSPVQFGINCGSTTGLDKPIKLVSLLKLPKPSVDPSHRCTMNVW